MSTSLFAWDSLVEIASHDLRYPTRLVRGKACEIRLTSGTAIKVWQSEDGQEYFCHGLTFGGKERPGGAVSPFSGQPVQALLRDFYARVPEAQAAAGDIVVWRGLDPDTTPHSAILADVGLVEGKELDLAATRLRTKNGLLTEALLALDELVGTYGDSFDVYRKR